VGVLEAGAVTVVAGWAPEPAEAGGTFVLAEALSAPEASDLPARSGFGVGEALARCALSLVAVFAGFLVLLAIPDPAPSRGCTPHAITNHEIA
jgi:hypothetical protein